MLSVEYVNIDSIKPYERNAKLHPDEQIEQICKSIKEFGFNDPLGVWNNEIVEGHGRYIAAKKLGIKELPIIRLDDLTDEQRRAYMLAHNKLTMNSDFDLELLNQELDNLSFDMSAFGFENALTGQTDEDDKYTKTIEIPHYEPTGEDFVPSDCYDDLKAKYLIEDIDASSLSEEEKDFLKIAAYRHVVFNYRRIAELYAKATPEMQRLMENSALVVIDIDNAIANGYVKLSKKLEELKGDEDDE